MRNLEDLLQDIGGNGRSQVLIVVLASLPRITMGWSMLTMSFANFVPKWCCLPDNLTATPDQYCQEDDSSNATVFSKKCWLNNSSCSRRVFASGVYTAANEWDLVCERRWMLPLTTSIQMGGVLVGGLIAGQMADFVGRKKTLYLNSASCAVFNIVIAFSPAWEMFATFRFLIGVTIGGYLANGVPYTTEFVLPSKRAFITILPIFQIGVSLMALVAWRLQDWRPVHWICGVMTAPFLLGYFFLPESLRWLTIKGRLEDAQKVVEWIAHWNKQDVPKDSLDIIKAVAMQANAINKQPNYTYIHIYKGWRMFKSSIILQFIWCVLALCAYGISFGAAAVGDNVYLNIFMYSIIITPGFVILSVVIDRIGRRKSAVLFFVLASACGFGSLAIKLTLSTWDKQVLAETIINVLNRALVSIAWSVIMVMTNEIYPTVIRGVGFGASNGVARVGAILAPFVLNFEDYPTISVVVISVTLLTSAVLVNFLDETSGKAMQDTITMTIPAIYATDIELKVQQNNNSALEYEANTDSISTISRDVRNDSESGREEMSDVNFVVADSRKINGQRDQGHLRGIDNMTISEKM